MNRDRKFLVGQRVQVADEIGTVMRGPTHADGSPAPEQYVAEYVWVFLPSLGYSKHFSEDNVHALPDGQL